MLASSDRGGGRPLPAPRPPKQLTPLHYSFELTRHFGHQLVLLDDEANASSRPQCATSSRPQCGQATVEKLSRTIGRYEKSIVPEARVETHRVFDELNQWWEDTAGGSPRLSPQLSARMLRIPRGKPPPLSLAATFASSFEPGSQAARGATSHSPRHVATAPSSTRNARSGGAQTARPQLQTMRPAARHRSPFHGSRRSPSRPAPDMAAPLARAAPGPVNGAPQVTATVSSCVSTTEVLTLDNAVNDEDEEDEEDQHNAGRGVGYQRPMTEPARGRPVRGRRNSAQVGSRRKGSRAPHGCALDPLACVAPHLERWPLPKPVCSCDACKRGESRDPLQRVPANRRR